MLRERPFTSGRSLQRHDRTRSNQMGGTLYTIPPQTPIYRTRSPGYRETLYKIVNLVRDHSFCAPSHPYESGAFNGPEAKNSRSQVRPAAFRFAVREGLAPLCGPFPSVTESNANPGALLYHAFCLSAHPYKSELLTGVLPYKNAARQCGAHICIALRGERGIRTPGTLPYTCFRGRLLQPLGHLTW